MTYEMLIKSVSEIVNNEFIHKDNLTLVYSLDSVTHRKLSEHIFYKMTTNSREVFEYTEEFDVEIGGIIIKFVINEM